MGSQLGLWVSLTIPFGVYVLIVFLFFFFSTRQLRGFQRKYKLIHQGLWGVKSGRYQAGSSSCAYAADNHISLSFVSRSWLLASHFSFFFAFFLSFCVHVPFCSSRKCPAAATQRRGKIKALVFLSCILCGYRSYSASCLLFFRLWSTWKATFISFYLWVSLRKIVECWAWGRVRPRLMELNNSFGRHYVWQFRRHLQHHFPRKNLTRPYRKWRKKKW